MVDASPPGLDGVAWVGAATGRSVPASPGSLCSVVAPAPAALRASPVASDGVLGSGVAAIYCRLVLEGGGSGGTGVAGTGSRGAATEGVRGRTGVGASTAASNDEPGWEVCTAGLDVTVAIPGGHAMQVWAVDAAGNAGAVASCGLSLTGEGSGGGGGGGLSTAAAAVAAALVGAGLLAGLGVAGGAVH